LVLDEKGRNRSTARSDPYLFYDWLCFFFPNFVFKEFEYSQIVKGIPLLLKNQGVSFAFLIFGIR